MRKSKNNSVVKRLVSLGKSQYVCLCAPYLRMMGLKRGDQVLVSFKRGRIVVSAKRKARA